MPTLKEKLERLLELFKECQEDSVIAIQFGDTKYYQGKVHAYGYCYDELKELLDSNPFEEDKNNS